MLSCSSLSSITCPLFLKSIAAFSNSKSGGRLLIGVHDKNGVTGLAKDIQNKKNKDKWEIYIVNLIKDAFGKDFAPLWLVQNFVQFPDKDTCIYSIRVSPNNEPIYLENVLYVRIGNTSQDLHGNDAYKFIKKRFHF